MPPSLGQSWRSFWHTMTSNDRHASYDSPFRTGQHVPLPQSRHAPLTMIATSAVESRLDLNSPSSQSDSNGYLSPLKDNQSSLSPYFPGMRSSLNRQPADSSATMGDAFDNENSNEIQMQNFSDGLPPPPPVSHSWKRIDRWAKLSYVELLDNLCEGCTQNDVNELETMLNCTLPLEVRDSLQIHDGQERGGLPTGIIFGCMLLDCEEIVHEWSNWRRIHEEFVISSSYCSPQLPVKAFAGASSSSSHSPSHQSSKSVWRQNLLARQKSLPQNAVQSAYAHPAWIPLARDWGGNYLAVDLAPGPAGKWGQVIIAGRDYDCKYVVARSWSAFLAAVADDLSSDKVGVDEESGELKLYEFKKSQNVEPPYLEILRWRCDKKYGKPFPKKQACGAVRVNSSLSPTWSSASPYGSPTSASGEGISERGRSTHRLGGQKKGPAASPRALVSSPLARVAEEIAPSPIKVHTDCDSGPRSNVTSVDNLIMVDTPRPSEDNSKLGMPILHENARSEGTDKENEMVNGRNSEMKTMEV